MKRASSIILMILLLTPSIGSAIMIDNFNHGEFSIASDSTPGQWPSDPLVEDLQAGIAHDSTLGGVRYTWAQKGIDAHPSTAAVNSGMITFGLDNDECAGGLKYDQFGDIDLRYETGIAFDISYEHPLLQQESSAFVGISLSDQYNQVSLGGVALYQNAAMAEEMFTYTFLFDDAIRSAVDLESITQIEFHFIGGNAFGGSFSMDSIYTVPQPVPEPSTIMLLGLGTAVFVRNRRKHKNG